MESARRLTTDKDHPPVFTRWQQRPGVELVAGPTGSDAALGEN
jgi:hypothetical protein